MEDRLQHQPTRPHSSLNRLTPIEFAGIVKSQSRLGLELYDRPIHELIEQYIQLEVPTKTLAAVSGGDGRGGTVRSCSQGVAVRAPEARRYGDRAARMQLSRPFSSD